MTTILKLIALGMAAAIRPTSLAAVAALATTTTPRRFLTAYVVAGFGFTIAIGGAVVWLFHGVEINTTTGSFRAFAEIAVGLVAITIGLLLLTGRINVPRPEADQPRSPSRWTDALSEHVSIPRAALAGPVTHLPGLLYLIALNLIITEESSVQLSLVDLGIYNALWFAVPGAALALSIVRPGSASRVITAVQPWAGRHGRSVLTIVCLTLGAALFIHGLLIR